MGELERGSGKRIREYRKLTKDLAGWMVLSDQRITALWNSQGKFLTFSNYQLKQAEEQLREEGPASIRDYVIKVLKNPPASR